MAITVDKNDLDTGSAIAKRLEETKIASSASTTSTETTSASTETTLIETELPAATHASTPASIPAAASSTTSAAPDLTQTFKDIFGEDVKTLDDAKARVKKLSEPPAAVESPKPKFANKYVETLNDYLEKGGDKDVFDRVSTVKINDLDSLSALRTQMKWENPELSDADIDLYLNDKYQQTEEDSAGDKATGKVKMTIDAKTAKEKLVAIQKQSIIPPKELAEQQNAQTEQERVQAWGPSVKNAVTEFKKLSIQLDDKSVFEYAGIDDESRTALETELSNIVRLSGLEMNDKNAAIVQNIAKERYIVRNFDKITKAIYEQAKTVSAAEARATYENAEAIKRGDVSQAGTKQTNSDKLFEKHLKEAQGS